MQKEKEKQNSSKRKQRDSSALDTCDVLSGELTYLN
jgi:hypothetical protein